MVGTGRQNQGLWRSPGGSAQAFLRGPGPRPAPSALAVPRDPPASSIWHLHVGFSLPGRWENPQPALRVWLCPHSPPTSSSRRFGPESGTPERLDPAPRGSWGKHLVRSRCSSSLFSYCSGSFPLHAEAIKLYDGLS